MSKKRVKRAKIPAWLQFLFDLHEEGIKGWLLDFDGCFVPVGVRPHRLVASRAYAALGRDISEAQANEIYSDPARHGIDWFLLMGGGIQPPFEGEQLEEFRNQVRIAAEGLLAEEFRGGADRIETNPGAEEFLHWATEIFGRKNIAIVTATPETIARVSLKWSGLERYFRSDRIFGCERLMRDGKIHDKTARFVWEEPALKMGLSLRQSGIVEDGTHGSEFALRCVEVGAYLGLHPKHKALAETQRRKNLSVVTTAGDWRTLQKIAE